MRPLTASLVAALDLNAAVVAEASAKRSLMPPEPGWDRLADQAEKVAFHASQLLRSGYLPQPQLIAAVRKRRGIRPVPCWSAIDRIVYRALTECVTGSVIMDRSSDAYVKFLNAPLTYGYELQTKRTESQDRTLYFLDSDVKYVLKSDVTAFYQYIDHAVLRQELVSRGADLEATDGLLELLSDVQGRSFGLPQAMEPSDKLSEIYIDRVERDMLRLGFATWRYNDDFRIACLSFEESLRAVEALDASMRAIGLAMSELKTNTYTFFNYLIDTAGIVPEEGQESLKLEEVEVAVGDYSDDFSQDPAAAVAFIKSAQVKDIPKDGVDLHTLDTDQARLLRRALNSLIDAPNPAAVEDTPRLIAFVPEMTPTIVRYLVAAYSVAPEAAIAILDKWVSLNSLNDWQRSWILFAIHHLGALDPKTSGDVNLRLRWTLAARTEAHSPITQVSASLALARSSLMTFSDLMNDFEHAPPAVSMQALAALRESFESNDSKANRARLMAVANSSELFKAVLIDANP